MAYSNGRMFSTKDRDNDVWGNNCAEHAEFGAGGGFWYKTCSHAFLNSPCGADSLYGFTWAKLPTGGSTAHWKLLVSRMTLVRKLQNCNHNVTTNHSPLCSLEFELTRRFNASTFCLSFATIVQYIDINSDNIKIPLLECDKIHRICMLSQCSDMNKTIFHLYR